MPIYLLFHLPRKIPILHQSSIFTSPELRLRSTLEKTTLLGRTPTKLSGPLKIPNNSLFPWSWPSICYWSSPQISNTCTSLLTIFREKKHIFQMWALSFLELIPINLTCIGTHSCLSSTVKILSVSLSKAHPLLAAARCLSPFSQPSFGKRLCSLSVLPHLPLTSSSLHCSKLASVLTTSLLMNVLSLLISSLSFLYMCSLFFFNLLIWMPNTFFSVY